MELKNIKLFFGKLFCICLYDNFFVLVDFVCMKIFCRIKLKFNMLFMVVNF